MDRKLTFVIYGIIVWLAGVVLIRVFHPYMYGDILLHSLFLAVGILSAPLTLIPIARLTGRTKHDMLVPTVIMAMPAMVMDGLATTFDAAGVTHVYADTALDSAYSAGLLLIVFWAFFVFALYWHRETA